MRATARPRAGQYLLIRVTGLVLAFLVIGHFALTHFITDVAETDSSFVAARWSSPLFVAWDWVMLVTAVLHGGAGAWNAVDEYARGPRRAVARTALLAISAAMLVLGTWTLAVATAR